MSTTAHQLSADCRALEQAGQQFIAWMDEYAARVGQEKAGLSKEFRRLASQARRLDQAVQRPMCVGVFGPSQSGKSYLISALARKGTAPLLADFAGQAVDFIRDLNPEGGRESTGLVTRFTIHPGQPSSATPVQMRLLTQTDIVKIIGNTYYADCDHSDDEPLSPTDLNELLAALANAAQPVPTDPLTADDVFDLQAYFERYFKGFERVRLLRHGFWEQASQLAPRLPIAERARLFGIIWGGVDALTQLYIQLYTGLRGLNFAGDAHAGLDALLPREKSIIDVQTLQGLGEAGGDSLTLTGSSGAKVRLPRSTVAALIAELKIVIREQPWDFFQHTDLLDFPGARSREQIKDLPAFLNTANALQSLFLRGKVAYLFERYCAEQELTSMLLCIGPSNQEVKSLPEMVYDWIVSTHGATPEQRARQATSLFLVLTKFDMEFEEKAGERSPESRWITRLESSLLNFFGKQHDWPRQWDTQGCFRNSYWLRNPHFKSKHIFDYDDNGQEVGIRPGESKRIAAFRDAFLKDAAANRHFQNPQQAWDAAFLLNDGGIGYLAENLRPLCNPALKHEQIAGQVDRLREQIAERVGHYYVSDNPEQELEKRTAVSRTVARHLIECAGAQRFGELLQDLQVHSDELADIYYRIETRLPEDAVDSSSPSIGTAVDQSKMQKLLGLAAIPEEAEATATTRKDDAALFAEEAVAEWMQDLHDLAGNDSLCDYYKLPATLMAEFVKELIAGAQRLRLEERVTEAVREATGFRLQFQQMVALPARLTANLLNNYINRLGYDGLALDKRPLVTLENAARPIFQPRSVPPNGPVLEERQAGYDETYYTDWIRGFLDLVERNARFRGGVDVDVAANRRLGELLASIAGRA
jgi:hypothetical protein